MRLASLIAPFTIATLVLSASQPAFADKPAASTAFDFDKTQIRVEQVAPGVAVLFGAGGNIGVSYGPDGVVLIDDQYAPMTAKINAAVAGLNSGPVRFLINTHWHGDHSGGNENLGKAGVTIFAHDRIRMRLAEGGTVIGNAIPPAPAAALPVVTFDQGITFHLNGDALEATFSGGGHTGGDTAFYWRKANVLHTGDLMMVGMGFPFIDTDSGGSAAQLIRSLDQLIARTNAQTKIIPGHGPVTDQATLIAWRKVVSEAINTVRSMTREGATAEAIAQAPALKLFEVPGAFFSAAMFIERVRKSDIADAH